MKREKRLTKRERKAVEGPAAGAGKADAPHIHCIECGRHLNPEEFLNGAAKWVKCAHGTKHASCSVCVNGAMDRLREHDRTGNQVVIAPVWH